MGLGPMLSSLMRSKTGPLLVALQITTAVCCYGYLFRDLTPGERGLFGLATIGGVDNERTEAFHLEGPPRVRDLFHLLAGAR